MLSKRVLCLWMAVACLGLAGPLGAQDTGRVEGRVARPGGEALPGVAVVIEGVGATTSDANGEFAFEAVPAGEHVLSLTLGTNATTENVTVAAGETREVAVSVDDGGGEGLVFAEEDAVEGAGDGAGDGGGQVLGAAAEGGFGGLNPEAELFGAARDEGGAGGDEGEGDGFAVVEGGVDADLALTDSDARCGDAGGVGDGGAVDRHPDESVRRVCQAAVIGEVRADGDVQSSRDRPRHESVMVSLALRRGSDDRGGDERAGVARHRRLR